LQILPLLETAINYLQNAYNTSRHLLKSPLHYRAKHKSLKSASALPILDDKAVIFDKVITKILHHIFFIFS